MSDPTPLQSLPPAPNKVTGEVLPFNRRQNCPSGLRWVRVARKPHPETTPGISRVLPFSRSTSVKQ